MAQTYYDVLGVAENAADSEIEAAFKSKAREVHPDRVGSKSPYLQRIAAEAFKELSEAKSVLLDHHKREKYDSALAYMRGSSESIAAPPRPPRSTSVGVPRSPSARATAPPPPTPHPPTKTSFWKPTNTKFSAVALLIGISGCAELLGALAGSESMAFLGLALVFMSLALFWWRHGMRPGIDPKVLGGSAFLFLTSIIFFSGWYGSLSAYSIEHWRNLMDGQAYRTSSQGADSSFARSSDGLQNTPTQPQSVSEQTSRTVPPPAQKLPIASLNREERQSLEAACSSAKYLQGPAAYDQCVESHLTRLASGPQRPDYSSLTSDEKQSIEAVCSNATYLQGPAAFDQCVESHLARLASGPRSPDLSGLTFDEKQSIEAVCFDAKYLQGPTEYNRCLVNQLETLKASRR